MSQVIVRKNIDPIYAKKIFTGINQKLPQEVIVRVLQDYCPFSSLPATNGVCWAWKAVGEDNPRWKMIFVFQKTLLRHVDGEFFWGEGCRRVSQNFQEEVQEIEKKEIQEQQEFTLTSFVFGEIQPEWSITGPNDSFIQWTVFFNAFEKIFSQWERKHLHICFAKESKRSFSNQEEFLEQKQSIRDNFDSCLWNLSKALKNQKKDSLALFSDSSFVSTCLERLELKTAAYVWVHLYQALLLSFQEGLEDCIEG